MLDMIEKFNPRYRHQGDNVSEARARHGETWKTGGVATSEFFGPD